MTQPVSSPSLDKAEYDLEEYKALRVETLDIIGKCYSLGQWVLIACAVIFSWLITSSIRTMPPGGPCLIIPAYVIRYAMFIPFAMSVISGIFLFEIGHFVFVIGTYIKQHEKKYSGVGGWEHYLTMKRDRSFMKDRRFIAVVVPATAWLALILANLIGALLVGANFENIPACAVSVR
jgi:hypothetical protein